MRMPQIVAMELVGHLYTCHRDKFGSRRAELNLAYNLARDRRLLPAPGAFLARRVFKTEFSNPFLSPKQVLRWMRTAIAHRSKDELGKFVRLGGIGSHECALDFKMVADGLKELREQHIEMIDRYRQDLLLKTFGPTVTVTRETQFSDADAGMISCLFRSEEWKRMFVKNTAGTVGASVSDDDGMALYRHLEPAGEFLATVLSQALTQGYKYWEKGNDAADYNLLLYLCDPSLVFVTDDGALKGKLRSEAARVRVISSEELARVLRT